MAVIDQLFDKLLSALHSGQRLAEPVPEIGSEVGSDRLFFLIEINAGIAAEEIGRDMKIPEGKSIEEYLNGFITKQDNTGDSGTFADMENLFRSKHTDSQAQAGNSTIFQI
ncbi:MAG: hypothetical protein IK093_18265 [Ruminiclostridium sp.]|nr:hypothetical protein [Ruminiclostridium sp.]